jgi:hypothetical protein
MSKADDIKARLDQLEAERLILTIEVRNELLRQAKALLPEAIRQAKGTPAKRGRIGKPGSPALLRLISRLAMRPLHIERPSKK